MAGFRAFATIDSFMDAQDQDANYGLSDLELGEAYLNDKSQGRRIIFNFDVAPLSGRTITSASLQFLVTATFGPAADAGIVRCAKPAIWVETEVTWNDYASGLPWTTVNGGGDFSGTPEALGFTTYTSTGFKEITGLKDFVDDALANRDGIVSLIIKHIEEEPEFTTKNVWRSSEVQHPRERPYLRIVHSGAPIGLRSERGFLRGVQRGVQRGGI
jgi:hypothetical protein